MKRDGIADGALTGEARRGEARRWAGAGTREGIGWSASGEAAPEGAEGPHALPGAPGSAGSGLEAAVWARRAGDQTRSVTVGGPGTERQGRIFTRGTSPRGVRGPPCPGEPFAATVCHSGGGGYVTDLPVTCA